MHGLIGHSYDVNKEFLTYVRSVLKKKTYVPSAVLFILHSFGNTMKITVK